MLMFSSMRGCSAVGTVVAADVIGLVEEDKEVLDRSHFRNQAPPRQARQCSHIAMLSTLFEPFAILGRPCGEMLDQEMALDDDQVLHLVPFAGSPCL